MKMTLINNTFNKATGETEVTVACRDGQFKGKAKLHPDDRKYASNYAGSRLAEERAYLQYLKYELRKTKHMLQAIQNLNKDLQGPDVSYIPREIQKRINLKLRDYKQKIEDCKTAISLLEKTIKDQIETRDKIIQRTKKEN